MAAGDSKMEPCAWISDSHLYQSSKACNSMAVVAGHSRMESCA